MAKATKAVRGDAGTDKDIAARLKRNPLDVDAKLDEALDESMDASDPPALTRPRGARRTPEAPGVDQVRTRAK